MVPAEQTAKEFDAEFTKACQVIRAGYSHAHAVKAADAIYSIVIGLDGMTGLKRCEDAADELRAALDFCFAVGGSA